MSGGQGSKTAEPYAYAKLATKGDVLPPFYVTNDFVKERDSSGNPTRIEVTLGSSWLTSLSRSPPPGQENANAFRADFHIGQKMKISKMHAILYWNADQEKFYIKSICKNAVKVDGEWAP
eukprot:716424-Hanusia_phi.AAC.1